MTRCLGQTAVLALTLWSACGGAPESAPAARTSGAERVAAPVERGPIALPIEGDPNGLWWDDAAGTLYVADDDGNRILKWTDARGFEALASLPAAPEQGPGLGQLVRTADGTILVTRFGYGKSGDIARVHASGEADVISGLDPARRRIGLTVSSDSRLFDAWFVKLDSGRVGAVGEISADGTEREVISNLKKPVGVLAIGSDLFVSDQDAGVVLRAPIANPAATREFAKLDAPDLLAAGPDNSLFAGSSGGNLYLVRASGEAVVFKSGFQQVRGTAYDPSHHRVFVAEHDHEPSDGVRHAIHILPVDEKR